ncbi:SRPBCC family protein [Phycicoccus flavus]|uniref:SRPBCC family protein n=1 Tax=Phycicoccus flavus TaxID=2502783 RepID=A0A8T6R332_9MICO|nr:SRPBCC family protein [Phycicoccus flavus]NHA68296.1 SRPBCC family protein [Phycicoccus flavus]
MDHVLSYSESVLVAADPAVVYDLVSDVPRTGEWSPVCRGCVWDDPARGAEVGAGFTGHNETPDRTWTTHSEVVVADRPREFAWEVGPGRVRWGYTMEPAGDGTRLTESWQFLEGGIAFFHEKFGDRADAEIESRSRSAHEGIPLTLATIKAIAQG